MSQSISSAFIARKSSSNGKSYIESCMWNVSGAAATSPACPEDGTGGDNDDVIVASHCESCCCGCGCGGCCCCCCCCCCRHCLAVDPASSLLVLFTLAMIAPRTLTAYVVSRDECRRLYQNPYVISSTSSFSSWSSRLSLIFFSKREKNSESRL